MRWLRRLRRAEARGAEPGWVRVATARQPEAEMLAGLLVEEGIPAFVRTLDVSNVPAAGACHVCVPADRAIEAHAILDPMPEGGATA